MKGTHGKLKDVSTGRSYLYYLFRCLLEKIITNDDNPCYQSFLHALNIAKKPQNNVNVHFI